MKKQDLKREMAKLLEAWEVGTQGCVTKYIEKWLENFGITFRIEVLQDTALSGTARY